MPKAKVCKCGHYRNRHGHRKVGTCEYKTNEGKCKDCNCIEFKFSHFIIGAGTRRTKPVLKMCYLNAEGRPHGTS